MVKAHAERLPILKYNFPFFCLFGLENVLCCALRTLAKLIDGIAQ